MLEAGAKSGQGNHAANPRRICSLFSNDKRRPVRWRQSPHPPLRITPTLLGGHHRERTISSGAESERGRTLSCFGPASKLTDCLVFAKPELLSQLLHSKNRDSHDLLVSASYASISRLKSRRGAKLESVGIGRFVRGLVELPAQLPAGLLLQAFRDALRAYIPQPYLHMRFRRRRCSRESSDPQPFQR